MKQCIDLEQLLEVKDEYVVDMVDQVRQWEDLEMPIHMINALFTGIPVLRKDPKANNPIKSLLVDTARKITIGRMHELLFESCEQFYVRTLQRTQDGKKEIFIFADNYQATTTNYCDALWSAVKQVFFRKLDDHDNRIKSHGHPEAEQPFNIDTLEQNPNLNIKPLKAFINDAKEDDIKIKYEPKIRVIITGCSHPEAWYSTHINHEFRVSGEDEEYYYTRFQGNLKRILRSEAVKKIKPSRIE